MSKTLYLMRHGQTLFNQVHKIQGWCDSPLTELGIRQAQVAGQYFKDKGILLDAAYASTSERACDTLEQVTDLPYQRVKGLKEWNFGRFEGEHEYLNPPLPYNDFFVAYGGESQTEVEARMAKTLQEIMTITTGTNILAVSHGASCANFIRHWSHTSEVTRKEPIANCCIFKFEFSENEFKLLEIINHDFSKLME
ncbi:broad specificity phosphatase PhoE [Enterococcus sp. PF1-24]|uniref:histidine phosphatase family protein n=1 Tax=unclassified Enterococcus TaxID=2608891 RepID=UPI0024732104|nr:MULTISPECIES: histidine phosphatase family protein [unclassified Enterococcus]MDH6365020.1 broad specificity phosphatase PhoE [Enterococcus sp. PFB1-1]MDH6402121.1 broad specificity phosphatase PhoE [Enterococcus sp. PF1-24]